MVDITINSGCRAELTCDRFGAISIWIGMRGGSRESWRCHPAVARVGPEMRRQDYTYGCSCKRHSASILGLCAMAMDASMAPFCPDAFVPTSAVQCTVLEDRVGRVTETLGDCTVLGLEDLTLCFCKHCERLGVRALSLPVWAMSQWSYIATILYSNTC